MQGDYILGNGMFITLVHFGAVVADATSACACAEAFSRGVGSATADDEI